MRGASVTLCIVCGPLSATHAILRITDDVRSGCSTMVVQARNNTRRRRWRIWPPVSSPSPVPHYRIAPSPRSLPQPTIYRQKLAPPGDRAGWADFYRQIAGGVDFWEGDPIMGKLFHAAGDIIRGRHINSVIISSRNEFFMWETF